jgi:hypothetical protein
VIGEECTANSVEGIKGTNRINNNNKQYFNPRSPMRCRETRGHATNHIIHKYRVACR